MPPSETIDEPTTRIPWPPILIAAAICGGLVLDHLAPWAILPPLASLFGGAVIALTLANDIWCALTLSRHRTTILPHRPASALVTDGPYRYSRNPIYVSHVATTLGVGLLLRTPWIALLTPLLVVGLTRLAILPEERHLSRKFGADFAAYAARTRRWL
jgi:protein-S-isoprenylcysteine O-methyltransferase Ste14